MASGAGRCRAAAGRVSRAAQLPWAQVFLLSPPSSAPCQECVPSGPGLTSALYRSSFAPSACGIREVWATEPCPAHMGICWVLHPAWACPLQGTLSLTPIWGLLGDAPCPLLALPSHLPWPASSVRSLCCSQGGAGMPIPRQLSQDQALLCPCRCPAESLHGSAGLSPVPCPEELALRQQWW